MEAQYFHVDDLPFFDAVNFHDWLLKLNLKLGFTTENIMMAPLIPLTFIKMPSS